MSQQLPSLRRVLQEHTWLTHRWWPSLTVAAVVLFLIVFVADVAGHRPSPIVFYPCLIIVFVVGVMRELVHSNWYLNRHLDHLKACKDRGLIDETRWRQLISESIRTFRKENGLT